MTPADMLLVVFCWVDDALRELRLDKLRSRGPAPILSDAEVITIEVVGEFLGLACDKALFDYFRRHHTAEFPALALVHRTTFARQAANLMAAKRALQQHHVGQLAPEDTSWLVDSMPLYACQFGRARFCKSFRGQAAYGRDHARRAYFYGFRLHLRVSRDGLVRAFELAPASVSDKAMLAELRLPCGSVGVGDRNYWSPELIARLRAAGVLLHAPYSRRASDPRPAYSKALSKRRWLIETVQGQLAGRYELKRVRARDLWHLLHRVTREVLSHTVAAGLCAKAGRPPLRFAALLAA
jgi:hypothetical protein